MPTADPVEPHTVTPGTEARPQVDTILEAKLHWPPGRDDWVRRERLIDQMHRATRHQVTLVAAPAGYGKTILVAQWLGSEQRPPAAWVSIDPGDNDPNRLWAHVAVGPRPRRVRAARQPVRRGPATRARDAAAGDRQRAGGDCRTRSSSSSTTSTSSGTPPATTRWSSSWTTSRRAPTSSSSPAPTRGSAWAGCAPRAASPRSGPTTSASPPTEAAALLEHEDVHLSDRSLGQLMQRTEGWPAGLYLATLSLADRSDPDEFVRAFSGGNRFVGDYLTEEVLSRHSPEVREFITSISILDRFSASLCDHVVGTTARRRCCTTCRAPTCSSCRSATSGVWFRFHHLFAAVARSELEITHPERVRSLHARAAEWFRDHGHIDEAVQHSLAAGDAESASLLVQGTGCAYVDAGRAATVRGLARAIDASAAVPDPAANVTAAWLAALAGNETALAARPRRARRFPRLGSAARRHSLRRVGHRDDPGTLRLRRPGRDAAERPAGRRARDRPALPLLRRGAGIPGPRLLRRGRPGPGAHPLLETSHNDRRPEDHPGTEPVDGVPRGGRARRPDPQPGVRGARDGHRRGRGAPRDAAGLARLHRLRPGPGGRRQDRGGPGHPGPRAGPAPRDLGPRTVGHDPPPARHGTGGRGGRPSPPARELLDRARPAPGRLLRRHGRHAGAARRRAAPRPHGAEPSRATR